MCYMIRSIEIYIKNMFKNLSLQAKYGLAATATPIIIFAGIYIAWGYASRSLKRNRQVFTRSMSIGVIHGGKPALQRLIDFHKARLDAKIPNKAVKKLKYTLITEKPDFFHLKSTVAKLEMTGKETEAAAVLEVAYERAMKQKKPHEAYEIEMLLVEMLIYQGEFKKAFDRKCFDNVEISDARRPLFKAILHLVLDNNVNQAFACWEEFTHIREDFNRQPSLEEDIHKEVVSDFKKFKEVVNLLKDDIKEIQALRGEKAPK
ncbi:hypothetical protein RGQ29_020000 [Quercus rubra]|uniref:Transmembrane protein n=1 Tax=Quercus rubra TaxID=3512 RepID=A0AAN7IX41_QUERU|nr:hypothetical protein RGQ29_020000 [Quercus rubra]